MSRDPLPPEYEPYPAYAGSSSEPTHGGEQISGGQVAITVVLFVLAGVLTAAMSFFGLFGIMLSDGCGDGSGCDTDRMTGGWMLALFGVWVPLGAAIVVAGFRGWAGRSVWWLPLLGALVSVGVFVLGWYVMLESGPPS